jgi:hypothetical protein
MPSDDNSSDEELEPLEDVREKLAEYEEKYPSAEIVDDGGVTVTNDEDEIAEARECDEYSHPDEARERRRADGENNDEAVETDEDNEGDVEE